VKRYRDKKRNVTSAVTVTPPETDTETDTENSEAKASGASAPDPRDRLFKEGLQKIAELTGKGPDSCRSFIGKCLKASDDDASAVLGAIDDAHRNRVADAPAWISARLKGRSSPSIGQKIPIEEAVRIFVKSGHWSRHAPVADISQAPPELLAKHGLMPDGRRMQ
jgi:hypothetical protein